MRYKVTLMYDGSAFHGWQIQPKHKTVQEDIEAILSRMHKRKIKIYGSGRTDAGVHALAQVFHFDSELKILPEDWMHALNNQCDKAIRILSVEIVDDCFHSRFSATSKTYLYRINYKEYDPFMRNQVLQYCKPLDVEQIRKTLEVFIGTHDFTTYNSRANDDIVDQVRTIYRFELIDTGSEYQFIVNGSGFLRYMVRMMVGSLIAVGEGKLTPEQVKSHLEAKSKTISKYNADPCGLYLINVSYNS